MENQVEAQVDIMQQWFDSSVTPDAVTLSEFDNYVDEYLAEREIAEALDEKLTEQNKKIMAMSNKLIEFLDLMSKKKHVVAQGTILKIETTKWKPPEGEGRENILDYLRKEGKYDSVMAFNAAKFSSWYKAEKEANPEFNFEGVELTSSRYIKFNKA